ncbi:hypothetical protein GCM10011391_39160 [Pullulanibacillus camelliae]|uniref:Transposase IS200-like domain-containing protein n=1 Tax=Pullulanibacillus camelliae TaxID=1707096 RepID=A0A8J3E155_9BACL|nr:hypothetical protein GCM10011391_39160 [Pullulanibacillus camelliae]
MPNHVDMLGSSPPKLSVSRFMGYLKGKSALIVFDQRANLKYKFENRQFFVQGTMGVRSVSMNEAVNRKYIYKKACIALDKFSVKEYEAPFKGGSNTRTF